MANKKMTLKEFKEVLKNVDIDLEFWGYEGILNMLAIHFSTQSKEEYMMGLNVIGQKNFDRSEVITNVLEERGYY